MTNNINKTGDLGFEAKLWLAAELKSQFAESARLEKAIRTNLKGLGYDA
jgi:hypothetical protein